MFLGKCGDVVRNGHAFCNIPKNRCTFSKNIPINMRSPCQLLDSFSANKFILIIDKLVKTTVGQDKRLTKCKKFRRKLAMWHALQKRGNGWMCIMDEKKKSLYKWNGRKQNNPYEISKVRIVFNVKCLKQCPHV